MMKRNSLLSLVLALCLCFMLAMPALAAEEVVDYVSEIEKIKQEEVAYQLQNYKQMNNYFLLFGEGIICDINCWRLC